MAKDSASLLVAKAKKELKAKHSAKMKAALEKQAEYRQKVRKVPCVKHLVQSFRLVSAGLAIYRIRGGII